MTKIINNNFHLEVYWFLLANGYSQTAASFEREAKKQLKEWRKTEKTQVVEDLRCHLGGKPLLEEVSKENPKKKAPKEDKSVKKKGSKETEIKKETNVSSKFAALIKPPPKFVAATGVPPASNLPTGQGSKKTFDSDDDDSSECSSEEEVKPKKEPVKVSAMKTVCSSESEPSSEEEVKPKKEAAKVIAMKAEYSSESDSSTCSSSSSSSSSSSDDDENEKPKIHIKPTEPKKKAKVIEKQSEPTTQEPERKKAKSESSKGVPFQRVDPTKVEFLDDRLRSNHFLDKAGATGSYGERAYQDLAPTRGKGFRQEKNKKKRGSYHGGRIDGSAVNSIKFPSSDEE